MAHSELVLWCPFQGGTHVNVEQLNNKTLKWAEDAGFPEALRTKALIGKFSWLVAQFYPHGRGEPMQLISDWTSWLFWHDDVCDETFLSDDPRQLKDRLDRLFRVLAGSGEPNPNNMFECSVQELGYRFKRVSSTDWWHRFLVSVREYFEACCWEASNRKSRVVPSLEEFIILRQCAGGMWIYLDFVELALGRPLTLAQRRNPEIMRAIEITNNVASWHNDLYSYGKEVQRGDVHNLIVVLQARHGFDVSSAFKMATSMIHNEVLEFSGIRKRVTDATLVRYLDALGAMMRGNLEWSASSGRYVAQGHLTLTVTPLEAEPAIWAST